MGPLLNALGHMSAGLSSRVQVESGAAALSMLEYRDAQEGIHPAISHFPFIVLRAENSNQIRKVRQEAIQRQLPFTDFVRTMTLGTSEQQLQATQAMPEEQLEYFGICLFGETQTLREFTGKFSLFK